MAGPSTTYSPDQINFVIDGNIIEGFSSDGITVTKPGEATTEEGIDGGATWNRNASKLWQVTVSLRAASKGAQVLAQLQADVDTELEQGNPHPDLVALVRDPVNGSILNSPQAHFMNEPFPDMTQTAGNVEFKFDFHRGTKQVATNLA